MTPNERRAMNAMRVSLQAIRDMACTNFQKLPHGTWCTSVASAALDEVDRLVPPDFEMDHRPGVFGPPHTTPAWTCICQDPDDPPPPGRPCGAVKPISINAAYCRCGHTVDCCADAQALEDQG